MPEQNSTGVQALRDIRIEFKAFNGDRLHTEILLEAMGILSGSPWGTWHHGKPLTPRGLAKLLRSYKIQSGRECRGSETRNKHGYLRKDFAHAWRRYS